MGIKPCVSQGKVILKLGRAIRIAVFSAGFGGLPNAVDRAI